MLLTSHSPHLTTPELSPIKKASSSSHLWYPKSPRLLGWVLFFNCCCCDCCSPPRKQQSSSPTSLLLHRYFLSPCNKKGKKKKKPKLHKPNGFFFLFFFLEPHFCFFLLYLLLFLAHNQILKLRIFYKKTQERRRKIKCTPIWRRTNRTHPTKNIYIYIYKTTTKWSQQTKLPNKSSRDKDSNRHAGGRRRGR